MGRQRLTNHTIYSGDAKAIKLPIRLQPTATLRSRKKQAADSKTPPPSAHPGDPNFDATHASAIMSDIAESVRSQLAKDYDARPPGLQTIDNGNGTMSVVADDPAAGLGVRIDISQIQPGSQTPGLGQGDQMPQQPGMGQPGLGLGPPPMPPVSPQQPGQQPPQVGLGPPPAPTPARM